MLKKQFAVVVVLSLTLVTSADAASLFQRMRISSGSYRISVSGPSVPAACLDLHRPTPTSLDTFAGLPPAASVTRTSAAGVTESMSLDKAVAAGWVRVSGNGTHWSIDVTPLNPPPGTTFELSVRDQFGVFGVTPRDANAAAKALRERLRKVSGQIDTFAADLHKNFGTNSGIAREFLRRTQRLQWRFLDPKEDLENLANDAKSVLDGFRASLTGGDPEETWENLAVFEGRALTAEESEAVAKLLDTKVATSQDKDFLSDLERLTKAKKRLDDAFGIDDATAVRFHRRVIANFEFNGLGEALKTATEKLVPAELDRAPAALDVLALMQGRTLTDGQADALREVSGRNLPKQRTGCLDKHLVLVASGSELILRTTTKTAFFDLKKFTPAELKAWVATNPRVVVDGQLPESAAKMLSDSGVKVVGDFRDVIRRPDPQPKRPFVIFAMSADPEAAALFMAGADTKQFVQAAKLATDLPASYSCVVGTKLELTAKLKSLGKDQFPVVVFNNTEVGIAFPDGAVGPEELAEKAYGLACNTFQAGILGYETTDYIDPVSTVKAIKGAVEGGGGGAGGGDGGGPIRPDDFFNSWAAHHDTVVGRKKKVIFASIGAGAGGAILGGILLALDSPASQPATTRASDAPGRQKEEGTRP